jgi:aminomethyltransferase
MLYKVDVRGQGAVEVVNRAVARDLTRVKPGRIAYGPVLNDDGKMLDDSTCFVYGDDHVRVIGGGLMPEAMDEATADHGLEVRHLRDELCHLTLQGPESRELLASLADADLSNEGFPYYTFKDPVTVSGIEVMVARMGFTAELGYEVHAPIDKAFDLWDAVCDAGERFGIRALGAAAIMMLRTEAGMVMGDGFEYDDQTTPWECNLGWAVAAEKPAFRGRDAVLASRDTVDMRLVSVRLDDGEDRATGAPLFHDGRQVGHITMSVPSPYLDFATLGLAKVPRDLAGSGTELTARFEEGDHRAVVVDTPVYDPERIRVKS